MLKTLICSILFITVIIFKIYGLGPIAPTLF